jgi:hypothetical protein
MADILSFGEAECLHRVGRLTDVSGTPRRTIAVWLCLFVAGTAVEGGAQTASPATASVTVAPAPMSAVLLRSETGRLGGRRRPAPDPVSNGVRNGAIVGAITGGAVFGVVAWRSCEDAACAVGVPLIWAGIGAGCGALIGLAIDRAKNTQPAPSRRVSAVVTPILSPRHRAVGVALRW